MAMEGRIRLGWYGHGRLVKSKGDGYRVGIAVEGSLFDFELGVLETQFFFLRSKGRVADIRLGLLMIWVRCGLGDLVTGI